MFDLCYSKINAAVLHCSCQWGPHYPCPIPLKLPEICSARVCNATVNSLPLRVEVPMLGACTFLRPMFC